MSLLQIWETFLERQERELGVDTVTKWLRPLRVVRFDAGNLYLEVSDSFQALWFEEHMRRRVQEGLLNSNGRKLKVHLLVPEVTQAVATTPEARRNSPRRDAPKARTPTSDAMAAEARLEHFIPHGVSAIALRLLQEVATGKPPLGEEPLGSFNPIVLFGPSGCGKTHLLMGVAAALVERGVQALYCRAETFTEHVIEAIRAGEMQSFRRAYRHVDALLVDDVQAFARKASTQEEFFHTFNALHVEGKQIILAANCPPSEMQSIEPRLVSRFEWGLSLPLESPPREVLKEILERRAALLGWGGSNKLLFWLVEEFPSGTRACMRALEALILRAHLDHLSDQHLTCEQAAHLLRDLISEERQASLSAPKILQAVAEHFALPLEDLRGCSQTRECVEPRQLAMYLCRQKLRMPYMRIGELFDRDHSTVMSAIKGCQKALSERSSDTPHHLTAVLKRLDYLCKA
ncbi:MAG: DnaA ATPase domain-containing protein [Chlamydiia bacterium]